MEKKKQRKPYKSFSKYKSTGKIKNATKVEVDGILFNSKLEAYCYEQLKNFKLDFKYLLN